MITILTLGLDHTSQDRFEAERQRYFPPALNRIPAHVTLFHALPGDAATQAEIGRAARREPFPVAVTGLRSLGRGVAYTLRSPALEEIHRQLRGAFADDLSAQDRQGFRPHVVVQNKTSAEEARSLLSALQTSFQPWEARAEALLWWEYLGGPWRLIERFALAAE